MTDKITPASKAIKTFGGVRPLARELEIQPSIVSRWQKSGLVPAKYQGKLLEAAKRIGKRLSAKDLVMVVADE